MDFMNDQFQHKFEQLLKLKDIYTYKSVMPQRIQRLKLVDINFQIKQIRQQQAKKLDSLINNTINLDLHRKRSNSTYETKCNLNINNTENICLSCQKYIFEKKVALNCSNSICHSFHSTCLSQIFKQQLAHRCLTFLCLCKSKISYGDIVKSQATDLYVYLNKLMENQVAFIKGRGDCFQSCANKDCEFFWYIQKEKKRSKSKPNSPQKIYKITYTNFCPDCRFG